jgi:hypothetical protein
MTKSRVAAVVALLALLLPTVATGSPEPLVIHTSFTPSAVAFGDTVVARIDVIADRGTVEPETVHTVYSLAPLTLLAPPVVHRVVGGSTTVVTYELRAACLSERCVAAAGAARPRLAPARADAVRRDGAHVSTAASWPSLEIAGRVSAADVAKARPPFRVDTAVPPVTYRIAPARLALVLDIAAALLVAAGLALGAVALRRRAASPATQGDALQRALALARRSRERPGPDRRSALGLVARLLTPRDRRLARSVDDLAWSRPTPTPDRLTDALDEVEREIRS